MTILSKVLSKVKTLIDYARFGMFFVRAYNYDQRNERLNPLHFPESVVLFDSDIIQYATSLTGYIKAFGYRTNYCKNNNNLEYINLPKCMSIGDGWRNFSGLTALKECRLPSLRRFEFEQLFDCSNLEILELGSLSVYDSRYPLNGTPKLHTVILGKGTNCNLYFQKCPNLTQECLHGIIDNVADRTGTNALTLYVHQEAYDRISEEYKTKLSKKNWNLAIGS